MIDVKKVTGANLRRIRLGANLTQDQLAAQLGMHKQNVSAMENGHRGISDHVIAELCEIFACPPSEFFRLTDGDHIDMVDELLGEEVRKLTRAGKAALYAHAVALNSGENLRRRRDDS